MTEHVETQRKRRGHRFYPTKEELRATPPLYDTDGKPTAEKIVTLHYFTGSADWWIVELDPEEMIGFGYACLGDPSMAEWGYVSLPELEELNVRHPQGFDIIVERDLHWNARPASECDLPGQNARLT